MKIKYMFLILTITILSCKKEAIVNPQTPTQTNQDTTPVNPDSILVTYKFISSKVPQYRFYAITKNNQQFSVIDTVYLNNTSVSTYTYKGAPYYAELQVSNDTVTVQKLVNNNLFCQNKHWQIAEVQCYY